MSITQLKCSSNKSQYFDNAKMELVDGDTYNHASYDRVFPLGQVRISFENKFVHLSDVKYRRDTYINIETDNNVQIIRYKIDDTDFDKEDFEDIRDEKLFIKEFDGIFAIPKKGYHCFAISWSDIEEAMGYDIFPYWFITLVLDKYGNFVALVDDCWANDFSSKKPRLVNCMDSKLITLYKFNDVDDYCAKLIM